jgi:hypothetical protein
MRNTALIVTLALAASMVACGDDRSDATTTDTPDTTSEADSTLDGSGSDASTDGSAAGSDTGVIPPGLDEHVEIIADGDFIAIADGLSGEYEFEVPEGAVSVMVLVEAPDGVTVNLASWVQDEGDALVYPGWTNTDQNAPALCTSCDNRVSGAESVFAALAPNNEVPQVVAGTHRVRLVGFEIEGFQGSPASAETFITVYAKVLPEPPASGTVNFNLHFSGARWTAESAQTDPDFLEMLEEVRDTYAELGLLIGDVEYLDIGEEFQVVDGISGAGNDLENLFRQSADNEVDGIDLFFVSELRQGGPFANAGVLLGIAGGIPGPALVHGTARNGVAVAVDSHDDPRLGGAVSMANTWAHEAGHYLGLFHTSEQAIFGPQIHDPIGDTPENDPVWLMHNAAGGNRVSPTQGMVVRGNPWIQH